MAQSKVLPLAFTILFLWLFGSLVQDMKYEVLKSLLCSFLLTEVYQYISYGTEEQNYTEKT